MAEVFILTLFSIFQGFLKNSLKNRTLYSSVYSVNLVNILSMVLQNLYGTIFVNEMYEFE